MKTFLRVALWIAILMIPNFLFSIVWAAFGMTHGFWANAAFGTLWGSVFVAHMRMEKP
jgi:hypothetical protein